MWNDNKLTLVRCAIALGALQAGGPLSEAEESLVSRAVSCARISHRDLDELRERIRTGEDPLGDALTTMRLNKERRKLGQFLTPAATVQYMVDWALSKDVKRLIDPGCGSGRFTRTAIHRNRKLRIIAVDIDPVCTLLTRAALACCNALNAIVCNADYMSLTFPQYQFKTAYVANPPYVRHNYIPKRSKKLAAALASKLGYNISSTAGLHALFFLATARNATAGDVGCFVTSSEWLDVNYGAIVRKLLLDGLGASRVWMFSPELRHFEDAKTTAAITFFEVGSIRNTLAFKTVYSSNELRSSRSQPSIFAPVKLLAKSNKWSTFVQIKGGAQGQTACLGDVARVHRGAATGNNKFFVLSKQRAKQLGIARWCQPAITSATEIKQSDGIVRDDDSRLVVFDPPADINRRRWPALDKYLKLGENSTENESCVAAGYLASHRTPWWRVRVPKPPIMVTYMSRSAPVFALNPDELGLLNIGHGVYPITPMSKVQLLKLVALLNARRENFVGFGRTYFGGLQKFEPREMEAVPFEFGPTDES